MMNIAEVRASLGMTRQALASLAGVSPGAVWSVENGKGTRDKDAATKIMQALQLATAPINPDALPKAYRTAQSAKDGWTIETEWNGLKQGQRFTVADEEGSFGFIRFVKTETGSWVDGYGGRAGYGKARSFDPEKVRTL